MKSLSLLTLGMALAIAPLANATNPFLNTPGMAPLQAAKKHKAAPAPTAWCKVDKNGQRIGAWHPYKSSSNTRNLGTPKLAWGATNGSGPGFFYTGQYGTPSGYWYFGDLMNARMVSNDTEKYNVGEDGGLARYWDLSATWNPGGTNGPSGTADCVLIYQSFNFGDLSGYGPADGEFVDGVAFAYSAVPGGYYYFSADASADPDLYMQLGRNLGSMQLTFATLSGSTIVQLPAAAAASTDSINFLSPTDTNFPGTNPSSSVGTVWYDLGTLTGTVMTGQAFPVGTPDYKLTGAAELNPVLPAELYDMDGGASYGNFEPMMAFYSDSSTRTIKGKIDFQGLNPSFVWYPSTLGIFVIDNLAIANDNYVTEPVVKYAPISDSGDFTLFDPNQSTGASYTISFVPDQHWLIKNFNVNTTGGNVNVGTINTVNGDCDLDNVVSVFDYIHLSDNFDKNDVDNLDFYNIPNPNNPIGPGNLPICFADLDHDGVVSVFDYIILSDNFDTEGDLLP